MGPFCCEKKTRALPGRASRKTYLRDVQGDSARLLSKVSAVVGFLALDHKREVGLLGKDKSGATRVARSLGNLNVRENME